jgi:hypothetical protein
MFCLKAFTQVMITRTLLTVRFFISLQLFHRSRAISTIQTAPPPISYRTMSLTEGGTSHLPPFLLREPFFHIFFDFLEQF